MGDLALPRSLEALLLSKERAASVSLLLWLALVVWSAAAKIHEMSKPTGRPRPLGTVASTACVTNSGHRATSVQATIGLKTAFAGIVAHRAKSQMQSATGLGHANGLNWSLGNLFCSHVRSNCLWDTFSITTCKCFLLLTRGFLS